MSYLARIFVMCFAIGAGAAFIVDGNQPKGKEKAANAASAAARAQMPPDGGGRCLRASTVTAAASAASCEAGGGTWTTRKATIVGIPSGPTNPQRSLRQTAH